MDVEFAHGWKEVESGEQVISKTFIVAPEADQERFSRLFFNVGLPIHHVYSCQGPNKNSGMARERKDQQLIPYRSRNILSLYTELLIVVPTIPLP